MHSSELVNMIGDINNKSNMIKLSLNKTNRKIVEEATAWIDNIPLKVRCIIITSGYTENTYPKCLNCGNPVIFNKAYNTISKYCSDKCVREYGRMSAHTKECLGSYDWLYQKRIVEKVSYSDIGMLLGCSEPTVTKAIKLLRIPLVRLNASPANVQHFLDDKDWLYEEHVAKGRQFRKIAKDIGSSSSTVSLFARKHQIPINPSNSYDRHKPSNDKDTEEKSLLDFIESITSEQINRGDRKILGGYEIDVLIPTKNIGFEYNGISHVNMFKYGAQNNNKSKTYHLEKTEVAKSKGVQLIHIFADDWMLNREVTKAMVSAKLGIFDQIIYARKCEIVTITKEEKTYFLNHNHMQGRDKSSIAYGLKYEGELVAVVTFGKSRYNKKYMWELSRFASKKYTKVIGGFSRLLSHFRKNHVGSIVSYADRCYSEGDVYLKNGFTLIRTNPPALKYIQPSKSIKRLHRANFMKKKIAPGDPRSEVEIMMSRGYLPIYDCGTYAFGIE